MSPTFEQVREARLAAGHTQGEAAAAVYLGDKVRWTEYESDSRNMDAARWELYLIKTGQHPEYGPIEAKPRAKARPRREPAVTALLDKKAPAKERPQRVREKRASVAAAAAAVTSMVSLQH